MENKECKYKVGRESLKEAYDPKDKRTISWIESLGLRESNSKYLLKCPDCREKITLVNGVQRNGFFKHFHEGERKDTKGRKNVGGGTSAWHYRWQMCFPEHKEKQIAKGEPRADVLLPEKKLAIEFQKMDFAGTDMDTCRNRTAYWNQKGYRIAWVFAWDGGSEFSGYFSRGTGTDGSTCTEMELAEYEKLFGTELVKRENIEIHFLSLDGTVGFEFLPEKIDRREKCVTGRIIPSYFQPFAPEYRKEMGKVRGKAVFSSHLLDPAVKAIDLQEFYREMEKAERKTAEPEEFMTLYEILKLGVEHDMKYVVVAKNAYGGREISQYKIHIPWYEEDIMNHTVYWFNVFGWYKGPGYKDFFKDQSQIYDPGEKIWKAVWWANKNRNTFLQLDA